MHLRVHFRHTERAGQHAVVAGDTTRFSRSLHRAVLSAFDGIRRTDLSTRGRIAMHAHHGHGLRRRSSIDEIELNHRVSFVGIALGTGLHAGVAADAAVRVDKEFLGLSYEHGYSRLCADARRTPCIRGSSKSGPGPQWSTGWRSCVRPSGTE